MYSYIFGLMSLFAVADLSWAQTDETADASDPTIKAVASHSDEAQDQTAAEADHMIADKFKSQMEETRPMDRHAHLSPLNPNAPAAVSLSEYLEFGMVPVDDLEAKLTENDHRAAEPSSKSLGRYYTVYARSSGSSHEGGAGSNDASDNNEEYEFTEDEEEADDDREDDDSEKADI